MYAGVASIHSDQWIDETSQIYIQGIVKAHIISKAFGANFIAIFQPLPGYKKNPSPGELNSVGNAEIIKKARDNILRRVSQLNNYVNFYNLSDLFADGNVQQ
ncbi:hypothetical protein COV61_05080, partial [Candidatus Micrarchaeota archaeon CG11_big_fil_rev_8_21_14_0_20_47_5]